MATAPQLAIANFDNIRMCSSPLIYKYPQQLRANTIATLRFPDDKRSGMFLHQKKSQAEYKYEYTDIHGNNFTGCHIWFKHLYLLGRFMVIDSIAL
ncbi:hypothetical protein [Sideroxyarcus emersonii]|uniref:hypothetical protein n=1 Tax=Sideroxyarcus emersonii TaxID=2764705 RepID=UPI001F1CB67E|nr:hypothetical protein [Sideroxyarcus emersonii]